MKKEKNAAKVKKPIFKKLWFWLVVIVVIGLIFAPSTSKTATTTTTAKPAQSEIPETVSAPSETSESASEIILMDGDIGEYGKEVTLNAGTEFEEKEITYYIPAGNYTVQNKNANGSAQVSVFSGGPAKNGEWEEFVSDDSCAKPIVVMAGETKDLEIKVDQFITLSDGASNISFTAK